MIGKVIEYNNEYGYIQGEDKNQYFFKNNELLEQIKINDIVIFRGQKEQIKPNYYIYKATLIKKQ